MNDFYRGAQALQARRAAQPKGDAWYDNPGLLAAMDVLGGMREGLVNPSVDNNLITRGLSAAGDYLKPLSKPVGGFLMHGTAADRYDPISGKVRPKQLALANPTATIGLRG